MTIDIEQKEKRKEEEATTQQILALQSIHRVSLLPNLSDLHLNLQQSQGKVDNSTSSPRLNPTGRARVGAGARCVVWVGVGGRFVCLPMDVQTVGNSHTTSPTYINQQTTAISAPTDAYSDASDDDSEEDEDSGRRRGAVVVDPSKLEGDEGYLAPDAIKRELPPVLSLSQPTVSSQWRPGGQGGGGVGDGSVAAGREAALHKFLEFKAAIKCVGFVVCVRWGG